MVNVQNITHDSLYNDAVELLKQLIATPSFSKEEDKTATVIETFLQEKNIPTHRYLNNVWATNKFFDKNKPSVLLNSHHDTVKPNAKYTKDPFEPIVEEGKLYGLGSNDAGGCLVSLIATFVHFYDKEDIKYNLRYNATIIVCKVVTRDKLSFPKLREIKYLQLK